MNFDGLKDDIIRMLAGERCRVNVSRFQNDLHAISCRDDVLTVLIHLGYLAYDREEKECYIPNKEIWEEFTNAVENTFWTQIVRTVKDSEDLLYALWHFDEESVASMIDRAHDEHTSILSYNDDIDAAISQIKRKQYPARLHDYQGNMLLAAVTYDGESKSHTCRIEQFTKTE